MRGEFLSLIKAGSRPRVEFTKVILFIYRLGRLRHLEEKEPSKKGTKIGLKTKGKMKLKKWNCKKVIWKEQPLKKL